MGLFIVTHIHPNKKPGRSIYVLHAADIPIEELSENADTVARILDLDYNSKNDIIKIEASFTDPDALRMIGGV